MEKPVEEIDEKSNKEVLLDLVREVTGFEHGLARTIIDLRKKPDVVLQQYLKREGGYVSPFRLLFGALGIWLFFNSYLIDWYRIWSDFSYQYINFLTDHVMHMPAGKKAAMMPQMGNMIKVYSTFAGDLFSKYYVPFVVVALPLSTWVAARSCRPYGTPAKSILVSSTYATAMSTVTFFVMSISFAFNLWLAMALLLTLLGLLLTGIIIFNLFLCAGSSRKTELKLKRESSGAISWW